MRKKTEPLPPPPCNLSEKPKQSSQQGNPSVTVCMITHPASRTNRRGCRIVTISEHLVNKKAVKEKCKCSPTSSVYYVRDGGKLSYISILLTFPIRLIYLRGN